MNTITPATGPAAFVMHGGVMPLAEKVLVIATVAGSESVEIAAKILGWDVPRLKAFLITNEADPDDVRSNYDPDGFCELHILFQFLEGNFCRRCGCTESNACVNEAGQSCSWDHRAPGQLLLCTSCSGR